jgi:DNA topoisomerase-1
LKTWANLPQVSAAHISKDDDKAMDKAEAKTDYAPEGVSVRNGPVLDDKMDVDEPATNGNAKRKARTSTAKAVNYNVDGSEGESDEDAAPLVCQLTTLQHLLPIRFEVTFNINFNTMLTSSLGQASKDGKEARGIRVR